MLATPLDDISDLIYELRRYNLKFLAEKVETNEEFNQALEMGFEYFQGYFFSKPEIVEGKDISPAQLHLLQIMAEVNQEYFEFSKVEEIISRDVSISYKLMRYINSAYYKRVNEISSIQQAIVLLGEKGIRSFLSLIAMSNLADDKPDELIRSSIIRAKFCELLAGYVNPPQKSSELFTLGLFSSIDVILDESMENIMSKLPLSENIKSVLIEEKGELKNFLELSECYERGNWERFSELRKELKIKDKIFPDIFFEAISWADAITSL